MVLVVFAIGVSAGWVVWGRNAKATRTSSEDSGAGGQRRIVLGTSSAAGSPASAPRSATSASLNRIFQALTIVDPDARLAEFIGALGEMKAGDASAVQQRLKADFQPEKGPPPEREAFFRRWGEVDPQGAIAFAKLQGDPKAQGWVLKLMVEGWARKDYAAAAQWLDEWPTAPDWEGVCAGLIKGVASKDPWVASPTAIASIPSEANWLRDTAVSYLAGAMARRGGVEEVKRWFASIPSGTPAEQKFKQKAMHATAMHLEHSGPDSLKQWLESQPPEPWRSSPTYSLVAKKLATTDRAAALNWLAGLPQGATPVGLDAGREIFQAWKNEKAEEASQWKATVPKQDFLRAIGALKAEPKQR